MTKATLLRTGLILNAVFSLLCGGLLIFYPAAIGDLIGYAFVELYMIVGAGLLLFALDLIFLATRKTISSLWAFMASCADIFWVVGTLLLLGIMGHQFSSTGVLIISLIAVIVMIFGILQLWGLKHLHNWSL